MADEGGRGRVDPTGEPGGEADPDADPAAVTPAARMEQQRSRVLRLLSTVFPSLQPHRPDELSEEEEEEEEEEEVDSSSEGEITFDRSRAGAHTYLGDRDDLQGSAPQLESGLVHLPLLPLPEFVLFPGQILPLRLIGPDQMRVIEAAMGAAPPLRRLLAVVNVNVHDRSDYMMHRWCCTAEVKQYHQEGLADCVNCVVVGRQRARLEERTWVANPPVDDLTQVPVTVHKDEPSRGIPPAAANNSMFWGRWAYQPFDAFFLAAQVTKLVTHACPKIQAFEGTPLDLSYWLAANLPFSVSNRQALLSADGDVERLRKEISFIHIQSLTAIRCARCRNPVSNTRDVIDMSDNGPGGAFVNAHGVVHGLQTVASVQRRSVELLGDPETEFSWFPGYAWTIAQCRSCNAHLGWRFTATSFDLRPQCFWGLSLASVHT
eukprot:jgi/Tetstr1/427353/TSEL_017520.t1